MVLTRERERQLIRLIQEKDDELALRELFASYRPLVGSVISRYFMELYDHQDWEQEALILCYRAAKRFDLKQEKPFAGFYKASLHNRIVNLIRRVKRQKHLAASAQVYWDDAAGELAADPR
ncbi:sigma factor, partial [Lactobacillus nasalidis]